MLYVLPLVEWDKNTINNILNRGYEVYKRSVNNTKVIAKEKQKQNPQVSFQFLELGCFLGYNQIEAPISISNYNSEHKYEFEIFSNSRLSESFMTLRETINSFFEQGGISGVLIFNGKTRAIFKTNLNTKEVYNVFDSHQCWPNNTAVVYYFKELNDLIAKMGEKWLGEKQNENIEFDVYSVKFNILLEQRDSEIEMIDEGISFDKGIKKTKCVPYDVKAAVKRYI
jgi:translation elongation factor EF-1beta